MNYKISYLLDEYAGQKIALSLAQQITDLSQRELVTQLSTIGGEVQQNTVSIPNLSANEWGKQLFQQRQVIYSETERQALIFLLTYSEIEELSVYHYQNFLDVSKGTILADIKKVRHQLATENIALSYERKRGFYLEGDEFRIRRFGKNWLAYLLQQKSGTFALFCWLSQHQMSQYAKMRDGIQLAVQEAQLQLVPSRLDEISYFLAFSQKRLGKYGTVVWPENQLIQSLRAYPVSRRILSDLVGPVANIETESLFFTICLMTALQGELRDTKLEFLLDISGEIIRKMELLAVVQFEQPRELLMNVYYHLVPAYFRINYGFYLPNVLIKDIRQSYRSLYHLCEQALAPLEKLTKRSIPSEEIGFFTILFGGEIFGQKNEQRQEKLKALIVCPSGISSSLILQSELRRLFPMIEFKETNAVREIENVSEKSYDIIFSTVPIETAKKVYLTKPIMSSLEKNQLMHQVQSDWLLPGISMPDVKDILDALKPYISLKKGVTEAQLYRVLHRKMNKILEKEEDLRPMLSELLTTETVQVLPEVADWRAGITEAAKPLLKNGSITEKYIDAMIQKVESFGPFIHICPDVALPHARPEDGVNQLGMSLLKIQKSVDLLEDPKHEIHLFICLAASDNETHLRALSSLTKILSKKESLHRLVAAETVPEILSIIQEGEK